MQTAPVPPASQYMPSTWVESAPARCSLRCLRACSSAGLSPNVRFIHVATRTAGGMQQVSERPSDASAEGPGPARTFHRAYLGHERADVAGRQPVAQALAPHQRVLVDDAVHPGLAQHGDVAGPSRHAQPVSVVPASQRNSCVHAEPPTRGTAVQCRSNAGRCRALAHHTFFTVHSRMKS